jgi:hypothetical protein
MKLLILESPPVIRYVFVLKAKYKKNLSTYSARVILVLTVVGSGRLLKRAVNSGLLLGGLRCSEGKWGTGTVWNV